MTGWTSLDDGGAAVHGGAGRLFPGLWRALPCPGLGTQLGGERLEQLRRGRRSPAAVRPAGSGPLRRSCPAGHDPGERSLPPLPPPGAGHPAEPWLPGWTGGLRRRSASRDAGDPRHPAGQRRRLRSRHGPGGSDTAGPYGGAAAGGGLPRGCRIPGSDPLFAAGYCPFPPPPGGTRPSGAAAGKG